MPVDNRGTDELRVAIVACGALTEFFYAPALRCLSDNTPVRVAALIDPAPARTALIGAQFPESPRGERLSDIPDGTDLAIVASPSAFHAEQTVELLARGMHVLCEKPMASSTTECDAMIEAARRADRRLAVGHFKRFFPATQQIKQLVDSQCFGRVVEFTLIEGGKFDWPARSRTFFDKEGGGGVLIDIGVHTLDLALWWFGEPSDIACEDDAMGGVEANCWVRLTYPGGAVGTVGVSRDWDVPNRHFIRFERGWVAWDPVDANHLELGWGDAYALKATTHQTLHAVGQHFAGKPAITRHQAFMAQLTNMFDAIRGSGRVAVSGEDGRRTMALLEACYAKSQLIDMPWMSETERKKGLELRCSR